MTRITYGIILVLLGSLAVAQGNYDNRTVHATSPFAVELETLAPEYHYIYRSSSRSALTPFSITSFTVKKTSQDRREGYNYSSPVPPPGWLAAVTISREMNISGFDRLTIEIAAGALVEDPVAAYRAAGYLEGYVTADTMEGTMVNENRKYNRRAQEWIRAQRNWIKQLTENISMEPPVGQTSLNPDASSPDAANILFLQKLKCLIAQVEGLAMGLLTSPRQWLFNLNFFSLWAMNLSDEYSDIQFAADGGEMPQNATNATKVVYHRHLQHNGFQSMAVEKQRENTLYLSSPQLSDPDSYVIFAERRRAELAQRTLSDPWPTWGHSSRFHTQSQVSDTEGYDPTTVEPSLPEYWEDPSLGNLPPEYTTEGDEDYWKNFVILGGGDTNSPKVITAPIHTHCSAFIKLTSDDLIFAHASWNKYSCLVRQYKTYVIANVSTVTMSSYPGTIHSLEDWYLTTIGDLPGKRNSGGKLAIMETTIDNMERQNTLNVTTNTTVPLFLRCMIATYVARNPEEWIHLFLMHNSGTCNNQWMIVDMKVLDPVLLKVRRDLAYYNNGVLPPPASDSSAWMNRLPNKTFYLCEQFPGNGSHWEDLSWYLRTGEMFKAYNIPYFTDVNEKAGYADAVRTDGWSWDYHRTNRAQMMKALEPSIVDTKTAMMVIRYNNYTQDPNSLILNCTLNTGKGGPCNPPYSATLALAARADLNPTKGSYGAQTMFVGYDAFGATDGKVTSWSMMMPRRSYNAPRTQTIPAEPFVSAFIQSGPTTSGGTLPVFDFRDIKGKPLIRSMTLDRIAFPYIEVPCPINGSAVTSGPFPDGDPSGHFSRGAWAVADPPVTYQMEHWIPVEPIRVMLPSVSREMKIKILIGVAAGAVFLLFLALMCRLCRKESTWREDGRAAEVERQVYIQVVAPIETKKPTRAARRVAPVEAPMVEATTLLVPKGDPRGKKAMYS